MRKKKRASKLSVSTACLSVLILVYQVDCHNYYKSNPRKELNQSPLGAHLYYQENPRKTRNFSAQVELILLLFIVPLISRWNVTCLFSALEQLKSTFGAQKNISKVAPGPVAPFSDFLATMRARRPNTNPSACALNHWWVDQCSSGRK